MKLAIEKAVLEAAPDVLEIVVEGVVEEKPPTNGFVSIGKLERKIQAIPTETQMVIG